MTGGGVIHGVVVLSVVDGVVVARRDARAVL